MISLGESSALPLASKEYFFPPASTALQPPDVGHHFSRLQPCRACTLCSSSPCWPQSLWPKPLVSAFMLLLLLSLFFSPHGANFLNPRNISLTCELCRPHISSTCLVICRRDERRPVSGPVGRHARRVQVLCADRCQCVFICGRRRCCWPPFISLSTPTRVIYFSHPSPEGEVVADSKVIAAQAAKMKKEFDDRKLCPAAVIAQAKEQRHKMLSKKKAAAAAKKHGKVAGKKHDKKHGKKVAGKVASPKRTAAKTSYVYPRSVSTACNYRAYSPRIVSRCEPLPRVLVRLTAAPFQKPSSYIFTLVRSTSFPSSTSSVPSLRARRSAPSRPS